MNGKKVFPFTETNQDEIEKEERKSSRSSIHTGACARHVITFTFKTPIEGLMYGLLCSLYRVLIPRLPVVTAQDHDLSLLASQRRKVWHLDDDGPGGEAGEWSACDEYK